jgi:hypothetical protein
MKLVNLTPHTIDIYNRNKELVLSVPPSGQVARVETEIRFTGESNGIPLFVTKTGRVIDLPAGPHGDTMYIVSGMLRSYVDRSDLFQPGELLRDDSGRPMGCIGLSQ